MATIDGPQSRDNVHAGDEAGFNLQPAGPGPFSAVLEGANHDEKSMLFIELRYHRPTAIDAWLQAGFCNGSPLGGLNWRFAPYY